jgi:hypothetical protein
MANSNKNIVITPNIGSTSDPKIVFSGADASTGAQNITVTAYPTNGGTLSFDGSAGQLLSISNSTTGTIFSANDVSGIPSIEVLDTGLVKLAQYSGNVLLGTGTDTGLAKLQVTGAISLTGNALYATNSRSIYGPNTSWSSYLYVGGDGVGGITRTASLASVVTTNGNLHLDSGSDKVMYLNYYSGTGGVIFCNGASATVASINGAGSAYFPSLGVGTAASGTAGEIRATNEITAYYSSDARLKENVVLIADPINKLMKIRGVEFDWTDENIKSRGGEDGYFVRKHDIGVIAQEVEAILPEIVATRDNGYKAVKYEKIIPLLIEAIKEQQTQINHILERLDSLANK